MTEVSNVRLNRLVLIFLCLQISLFFYQPTVSITTSNTVLNRTDSVSQITTTLTVLVVLMEFPDDSHHSSHTIDHFNDLFFSETQSFSVRQYFQNSSYGTVDLIGEVLGWFTTAENLAYYGAGERLPYGSQDSRPTLLAQEALSRRIFLKVE